MAEKQETPRALRAPCNDAELAIVEAGGKLPDSAKSATPRNDGELAAAEASESKK